MPLTKHDQIRKAVRNCVISSLQNLCASEIRKSVARRQWDDLDNLDAAIERAISDIEQPDVRSTMPEEPRFQFIIDYIGAFAYWDLLHGELISSHYNIQDEQDMANSFKDSIDAL